MLGLEQRLQMSEKKKLKGEKRRGGRVIHINDVDKTISLCVQKLCTNHAI